MPKISHTNSFGMKPVDELLKGRFNVVTHRGQVAWTGLFLAFGRFAPSYEMQTIVGLASDFIIAIGCDFSEGTADGHREAAHHGNARIIGNGLSRFTLQFRLDPPKIGCLSWEGRLGTPSLQLLACYHIFDQAILRIHERGKIHREDLLYFVFGSQLHKYGGLLSFSSA